VLTADLFAEQIRSSGKKFLEHLVGTTSAVAAVSGRPDLVHAALLHATFNLFQSGYEIVEHEAIRLPIESLEKSARMRPPFVSEPMRLAGSAGSVACVSSVAQECPCSVFKTKRSAVKQLGKVARERHEVRRALSAIVPVVLVRHARLGMSSSRGCPLDLVPQLDGRTSGGVAAMLSEVITRHEGMIRLPSGRVAPSVDFAA
jgi:hypothetical protein